MLFELLPYEERVRLVVSEPKCIINVRLTKFTLKSITSSGFSCITSVATLRFPFLPAFTFSSLNWLYNKTECIKIYLEFVYIIEKFKNLRKIFRISDNQLSLSCGKEPCNFSSEHRILEVLQLPQSCGQFPWVDILR